MKKILALALALCMILAAVPALALELLPAGDRFPLDSDITVTWYMQDSGNLHEKYASAAESPFHVNLSEKVGVNIEFSFPTTGADGNAYTTTLFSDVSTAPNIMLCHIASSAAQYMDDEIIWDLTPYIQEYAPAYYAFLQTNPAYDRAVKDDDGRYYSFGFFREDGGWNDSYQGPVIRKDWLEECGLEIPRTISEFENVIRVFHDKYGATFDTSYGNRWKQNGIAGAFGAYGNAGDNSFIWYVKDGKVNLGPAQPEYREMLIWLNKMWSEGLIDQDMFTEDDTTIKAKIHNDLCGIAQTSMGQMNNWNKERVADGKEPVWIGIPYPTDDEGNISSIFGGFGIGDHTTVITKSADEETLKVCLQILDYAYTEEGNLYWNYGVEGVSWVMGDDGIPKFTALVNDDMDTDPMTKYNGATWGSACIQATNLLYLKNDQAAIEADDAWFYVYGKEAVLSDPEVNEKNLAVTGGWRWPVGVTFTTEESDELDMIAGNIPTFVEESYAAFMTGTKDINDDAAWEQYLADLETYNLSRVLEIRQACYDRYLAR